MKASMSGSMTGNHRSDISATADLTPWLNQLFAEIDGALADLAHTMKAVADGSYVEKASSQQFGVMRVEFSDANIANRAVDRACETCFRSMMASFISFLDKLIASQLILEEGINIDRDLTLEELSDYLKTYVAGKIAEVARDRKITNPKKLARFDGLSDLARQTALEYFALRRCLEHHQGIPTEEIRLFTWQPKPYVDDVEITELPALVTQGQTIQVKFVWNEKIFQPGCRVILVPEDLHAIAVTLRLGLASEIFKLHSERSQQQRRRHLARSSHQGFNHEHRETIPARIRRLDARRLGRSKQFSQAVRMHSQIRLANTDN
jgi:hypothetical protein